MKHRAVFTLLIALAGLALLIGCLPTSLQAIAGKSSTGGNSLSCMDCHSGETISTYGLDVLAAKAQYENSGHYNGARVFEPSGSAELYIAEGSNAMYCNSGGAGGCSQCHTDQGFVGFVDSGGWNTNGTLKGTPVNVPAASQPGCFTCHKPHETGDFTLRTQAAVTLVDGTTVFDKGKGNLCVSCHKARTPPALTVAVTSAGITATATGTVASLIGTQSFAATSTKPTIVQVWSSSSGPHHGPQSDFMEGINNWPYPSKADYMAGSHLSATDSCVTCHMYEPASRLGGTLALGGHGTYLTDAVHGTSKDLVDQCKTCHKTGGPGSVWPTLASATTFQKSGHTSGDIDGLNSNQDILLEIEGLKKTLLGYFGNGANFLQITYSLDASKKYIGYTIAAAAAGMGPVTAVGGGIYAPGSPADWHKNWEFNSYAPPPIDTYPNTSLAYPALTLWQSQAFWNLKLFIEDKSGGIHNPTFAARMLFDAVQVLNDNGAALTLGTRP